MARRNNPYVTFAMFLALVGAGYASYHFLYEEKIFAQVSTTLPPNEDMVAVRHAVEQSLSSDECFVSITAFNWRDTSKRYRVDITMPDGCGTSEAKKLARRVSEVVERASSGKYEAEVSLLILGREVYHYVP